jgi:curli biogenesis system outer membrane secretion channel CsgG
VVISSSESYGYTTGLRDMFTTAMVQSKRYRVLERQNIDSLKSEMALTGSGYTDKTGVTKGAVKGADLLVMGAITGWEPGTSGGGGGLGRRRHAGHCFGAIRSSQGCL